MVALNPHYGAYLNKDITHPKTLNVIRTSQTYAKHLSSLLKTSKQYPEYMLFCEKKKEKLTVEVDNCSHGANLGEV
jgi:hypothetical protein